MRSAAIVAIVAIVAVFFTAVILSACGEEAPAERSASQGSVGPAGGVIEVPGARLSVPPGALSEPTTITIVATAASGPPTHDALSPVFEFGPQGLRFALPITVELTYSGDGDGATVLWSSDGSSYEEMPSTLVGSDRISAQVVHFSRGLVGRRHPKAPESVDDASASTPDESSIDAGRLVDAASAGDGGVVDASVEDASTPADAGSGSDAGPPADGGSCVPYLGTCTGAGQCCSNVPCIHVTTTSSVCAFAT